MFDLSFSKTMTLNCSSFVYYSWKSFFFTEHTEMCWEIDQFFKNKYRPMAYNHYPSILRRISITWLLLTEKHLCWRLFLILSIAKFLKEPILKNICERLLLKMCSWNWEKLKFIRSFNFRLKNQYQYSTSISETSENDFFFYFMTGFP